MPRPIKLKEAIQGVLLAAHPDALSAEEILDRLPARDALIAQCRIDVGVGARFAAASMVRNALAELGAEVQLSFQGGGLSAGDVRIVYRSTRAR